MTINPIGYVRWGFYLAIIPAIYSGDLWRFMAIYFGDLFWRFMAIYLAT